MTAQPPFGMPPFDPSKMDPKVLMELTQLIRQLPPEKLAKMQSLMHNMMAGFDVQKEMDEFEKTLPPGFREKLFSVMLSQGEGFSNQAPSKVEEEDVIEVSAEDQNMDLHQARITILRAVADGKILPEDAEKLLFQAG